VTTETQTSPQRGPLWAWLLVWLGAVGFMFYLRFIVYPQDLVPLTYALPLLIWLWYRDLRLLWGMVVVFMVMSVYKIGFMIQDVSLGERLTFMLMQMANIGIVGGVCHGVVVVSRRLDGTIARLEQTNGELEASNEELAAREEEITRQNEELQSQSEELEQQMEELNAQAEELQGLNEQLAARERTLNDLLETSIGAESEALARLGEAVERLLGPRVCAAAILEPRGERMTYRSLFGVAQTPDPIPRERTAAALAVARDRAAFVADLRMRPDLDSPAISGAGQQSHGVRSVLAAPLRVGPHSSGALEIYSTEPGEWTEEQLRVAQWLAEQCGRVWSDVRLRAELNRQRELLRTVTENASAALFMTDDHGTCTYMNPAAERLIECRLSDVSGWSLHELVHGRLEDGGGHAPADCPLHTAAHGGERVRDDVFVRASGERFPVVCVAVPVTSQGGAQGTILEVRDISSERRHEQEREVLLESERAARAEAERAGRAKDEFVATLSHELRTPLNAILGWASLLRRGPNETDEMDKGLEVIERNARHQSQLISELLDISRITAGKVRLEVQVVDLPQVIERAIEAVRPAADGKGVKLDKIIEPVERVVMGDPGRLQQIVWNLLSNAIKFTPKGGVVQVVVARAGSCVKIAVSDSGQGIDPDLIPHLFERYRQGDASATRRHGGLGLGLAIAKNLTELHGGEILASSDGLGKGSIFTVLLPVRAVDPHEEAPEPHPQSPAAPALDGQAKRLETLTVLIVEDEPDARDLIRRVLEDQGATVAAAASGAEAIQMLDSMRPDLLISDIGMPEMDGYSLIRRIRNDQRHAARDLPAIALTAFARSEDRTRAMLAGFQAHISKPVEPAELVATVASLTGAMRRSGEHQ
jgi:PAS domain S-box-containing protein